MFDSWDFGANKEGGKAYYWFVAAGSLLGDGARPTALALPLHYVVQKLLEHHLGKTFPVPVNPKTASEMCFVYPVVELRGNGKGARLFLQTGKE